MSRFIKSSLVVMGILTENFIPAALTVFAWSALKSSYILPLLFKMFFVKYTKKLYKLIFSLKITFFRSLLLYNDRKKCRKKMYIFGSWYKFQILQNFWLPNFRCIYIHSTFNKKLKMIFLGKLLIYVGYGIMKKKSEKLFESAIYSKKKKSVCFRFWFIDSKLMYAFLKPPPKISPLDPLLKNISQVNNVQSFKNMQLD
jgi:hypothetical protein